MFYDYVFCLFGVFFFYPKRDRVRQSEIEGEVRQMSHLQISLQSCPYTPVTYFPAICNILLHPSISLLWGQGWMSLQLHNIKQCKQEN